MEKKKKIIQRFREIVDRDGKNGKALTLSYVLSVLDEILSE